MSEQNCVCITINWHRNDGYRANFPGFLTPRGQRETIDVGPNGVLQIMEEIGWDFITATEVCLVPELKTRTQLFFRKKA